MFTYRYSFGGPWDLWTIAEWGDPLPQASMATAGLFGALSVPVAAPMAFEQLPSDTPVIAGDENFAVAAWESVRLSEEDARELADRYEAGENGEIDDAALTDLIGLANITEITASVCVNGDWTPPVTLTDNYIYDFNPKVAVCGNKAVVVWEQTSLAEDSAGTLALDATVLWYSVYDGTLRHEVALHIVPLC
jgi:hypothetical protein